MLHIPSRKWTKRGPPKRVLAIRLQATGDVVITLPYLQDLLGQLPHGAQLDFLTLEETAPIPRSLCLFDRVFSIGGGRNTRKQTLHALLLLPALLLRRYDAILDLQNNRISRVVTRALLPAAWSRFDRFSPIPAGERTRLTILAAALVPPGAAPHRPNAVRQDAAPPGMGARFRLKDQAIGPRLLRSNGWNGTDGLVLLNPAGAFETRHWEINNYVAFARLWLEAFPSTRFLVLGTPFIAPKAEFLKEHLGDRLISLAGRTTAAEAFAVLQHVSLALSEDSGMMHMAWTSGIPTVALFGSTRSDWSRPLGTHTFFLDSSDLPCGNCMQSVCAHGDVRCMTRYTPEKIFGHALSLMRQARGDYA